MIYSDACEWNICNIIPFFTSKMWTLWNATMQLCTIIIWCNACVCVTRQNILWICAKLSSVSKQFFYWILLLFYWMHVSDCLPFKQNKKKQSSFNLMFSLYFVDFCNLSFSRCYVCMMKQTCRSIAIGKMGCR